jgi:hypothetical protein
MTNYQKLEERLRNEGMKPIPKWIFSLRQTFVWALFLGSVVTGAIGFSIILYAVQQADFSLLSHITHSPMEKILALIPLVWLAGVIVFLTVAITAYRHTWKAYKFSPLYIFFISVLLSMATGTLFFISGGARQLDMVFDATLSVYEGIEEKKSQMWYNPDKGLLYGDIMSADSKNLVLKDKNGVEWQISIQDAFAAPILTLEPGEKIKIIGKRTGDHTFDASELRPWGGHHGKAGRDNR